MRKAESRGPRAIRSRTAGVCEDDRGSWQTVGIVTDVEPFFHELLTRLDH